MIPYGRQVVDEEDVAAVADVLRGDWLTQGPAVEAFEAAISEYVGAKFAIAFSSCTAALHGAAWAGGLGPGDLVYTTPLTFMASANAARYVGATPALVDIDENTWNMDLSLVPAGVDGLIPVHYSGLPVDFGQLPKNVAPRVIIEDAAHALGAETSQGKVGNCSNSDMTCFSFHPVKPITAGEGGMVTTNDEELAGRLRTFRSHGIVRKPANGDWYYEITDLGFHYRMTDIQAALGLSQLKKLDTFVAKRNKIAEKYRAAFEGKPGIRLQDSPPAGFRHGYHLFPIRVSDRRRIFDYLRKSGIGVQVHYVPVHHHPISSDITQPDEGFPVVDAVYQELISLPIYPGLTDIEQNQVIELLIEAI